MRYRGIEFSVVQNRAAFVGMVVLAQCEPFGSGAKLTLNLRPWPQPSAQLIERWLSQNCGLCPAQVNEGLVQ